MRNETGTPSSHPGTPTHARDSLSFNADLRPSHPFDLGYLGDLTSRTFLRLVHDTHDTPPWPWLRRRIYLRLSFYKRKVL